MLALDSDAVECDLAETYHIYNYKELPPTRVALFCVGLRENSRIKMKLNNLKIPLETMLEASILDRLSLLLWSQSKDAQKGKNKPESVYEMLMGVKKEKEYLAFNSGSDFEDYRNKLLNGGI